MGYNMDDCRAAAMVADALVHICGGGASAADVVDVGSLEVGFPWNFGKFDSALPEFAKINDAAYWDYQRDRVYIRSNPSLQRAAKIKHRESSHSLRVNATGGPSQTCNCPICNSKHLIKNGMHSRLLFDMRFTDGCIRRWITKYVVDYYKCGDCGASFASDERRLGHPRYGKKSF
jgi:DNA-directed RNA polymerase subunit RPC12/RpoP